MNKFWFYRTQQRATWIALGRRTPLAFIFLAIFPLLFPSFYIATPQAVRVCRGDLTHVVKDPPYDFVLTSRVETYADYKLILTCIQNNSNGYFRFLWAI